MGSPKVHILVVGGGSIGKRHVRNLLTLGADVTVYRYRKGIIDELQAWSNQLRFAVSLEEALTGICDAVVIANSTELHIKVALAAARLCKHLFIEKPLSTSLKGVDELVHLVEENRLIVETGFMLRLHPNLKHLKARLDAGAIGIPSYARAAVGQYLPDWRPGTDYRQSYSASRRQGGGVILDLVHELDLIAWLLGDVDVVAAMVARSSLLEIETEAIAQIGLRMNSGVLAQVHLDYLRPGYTRSLEIVGSEGIFSWDYLTGTLNFAGRDGIFHLVHQVTTGFERNDMFLAHMRHFLAQLSEGAPQPVSSLADGIRALRIALACHLSSQERRFVRPYEVE